MIDDRDKERLHDWIDGRLSEPEAEAFARRVMTDPELSKEHAELSRLVSQLAGLRDERAPAGFAAAVTRATASTRPVAPHRPFLWLGTVVSLAAALVLGAVFLKPLSEGHFGARAPSAPAVDKAFSEAGSRERSADSEGEVRDLARDVLGGFADESEPAAKSTEPAAPAGAVVPAEPDAAGETADRRPAKDEEDRSDALPKKEFTRLGDPEGTESKDDPARSGDVSAGKDASVEPTPADARDESEVRLDEAETFVWRVRREAPDDAPSTWTKNDDRKLNYAEFGARKAAERPAAVPAPMRSAIETIRARAPQRVVEIELDEAELASFLSRAAEAGLIVEEFSGAAAVGSPAAEPETAVTAATPERAGSPDPDPLAAASSSLSRAGKWNRLAPNRSERARRGDPSPSGAPGAPTGGGSGGPGGKPQGVETAKAKAPTSSDAPGASAGNEKKSSAPAAVEPAPKSPRRVIVIYEFDPAH